MEELWFIKEVIIEIITFGLHCYYIIRYKITRKPTIVKKWRKIS